MEHKKIFNVLRNSPIVTQGSKIQYPGLVLERQT